VRHTGGAAEPVVELFGGGADGFFRAQRIQGRADLEASFAVLVVLAGNGRLRTERGGTLELRKGSTLVVPHVAGASTVEGEVMVVRCRPPLGGAS
ncbi:MAG TPA: mannose-6-phosphate isomerase, partial [Pseudonocardiaceae bacterium]|nr:mannose-6-phosphate isomerase [Pseudonocardiaceae bacterium]